MSSRLRDPLTIKIALDLVVCMHEQKTQKLLKANFYSRSATIQTDLTG